MANHKYNGGDAIRVNGRFARVLGHSYWSKVREREVLAFRYVLNGHFIGPIRTANASDVERVQEDAPCLPL